MSSTASNEVDPACCGGLKLYQQALREFRHLLSEAFKRGIQDPSSMAFATADSSGRPSVRILTLKSFDEMGLVFFSDRNSHKGCDIEANPRGAACFYWSNSQTQIRFEGRVEQTEPDESDAYWTSRDREQQLGACASRQSEPMDDVEELKDRVRKCRDKYRDQIVPRPENWVGYRLKPELIEFWKGGWHHMYGRECYRVSDGTWIKQILNP